MKKLILIGCGTLGGIIAREIKKNLAEIYTIVGLYDHNIDKGRALAEEVGCPFFCSLEELLKQGADYAIEAANPDALKEAAPVVLENGMDMIVLSSGAFADTDFCQNIREKALERGRRIYIASGAIGGFDIMQTAIAQGNIQAAIYNIKPPESLQDAPFLEGRQLDRNNAEEIFSGNAKDAIEVFPKNLNVAVAVALATVGSQNTQVIVRSDPGINLNTHRIELTGDFGYATLEIASKPSVDNPRSSSIAAYSVIAKLRNLENGIVFC